MEEIYLYFEIKKDYNQVKKKNGSGNMEDETRAEKEIRYRYSIFTSNMSTNTTKEQSSVSSLLRK